MDEDEKAPLKLKFDSKVRLEFHGATITSDAGLLACRELDDALGLTDSADEYLHEGRTGRNIRHRLVPLLRQSVYSRLAGYEDTNDAERLAEDPAMKVVVGWQGSKRKAASTSEMSRFETELLTQKDNLSGLEQLNVEWVERAMAHTVHRRVILDVDSSESPVHGQQKMRPTMVTSSVSAITRCSASISSGTVKVQRSDPAMHIALMAGRNSLSLSQLATRRRE
jgi:hypothetical protein